ncbi:MAG: HK97 gp10 family phage protein [Caenispirillum sp.]|nr:HK97 gp10 family phage protein [Caenispirillum sp.]
MPVTGTDKILKALRDKPRVIQERVKEALEQGAQMVLEDMKALTPVDSANPGPHARDGLTITRDENGLAIHVGLPTPALATEYFWFRFLDMGTRGREVTYRKAGSRAMHKMQVPPRQPRNIRITALDMNYYEIERLVKRAIQMGLEDKR